MKRSDVAAELRKAQAGTPEEQRLALVRLKIARQRVNQARSGRTTTGPVRYVAGEARGGPPLTIAQLAGAYFASLAGGRAR